MTWEMGFAFFVIIIMIIALIKEIARPEIIVLAALMSFFISGILTPADAFSGFANEGMLIVALLFMIAGAIQNSGIAERAVTALLRNKKTERTSLSTLLLPITAGSAFLNNTPIVVTLTPIVRKWCVEHNISPSKFLIPLSYASILGGIITLMGTSTNLVIHGLMVERGMEGYSLFTLAKVSLPASFLGIIYLVTVGYKLLPDHSNNRLMIDEDSKEYLTELIVEENYPFLDNPLIEKTIEAAGLRNLEDVFLLAIIRSQEKIYPVKKTTKMKANDRLIFTGNISKIAELQERKGLTLATGTNITLKHLQNGNGELIEVVISHQSSLLYRSVKEAKFRSKYDAGIIAIHRNHERIDSKIGDIVLKPGDSLLLLAGTDFRERSTQSNDFYVVTSLNNHPLLNKLDRTKSWLAVFILLTTIVLIGFNMLTILKGLTLVVISYFIFRIITIDQAKRHIQWNVLLLIASSLGIGEALYKTGAADWMAAQLLSLSSPLGSVGAFIFLYVLTIIISEVITNSAAAVFIFPVALEAANQLNEDPLSFLIVITIAASASFLSPIGYQTNLIVYGPGGYKFTDYIKVGLPLSMIVMATTIFMIGL